MTTTTRNYHPVSEGECPRNLTPHKLYRALAIDAGLRHVNAALPCMSDEETARLTEVAEIAAMVVLKLLNAPDSWPAFLDAAAHSVDLQLRSELCDAMFQMLPTSPRGEEIDAATKRVHDCAAPQRKGAMQQAMWDLDLAYGLRNIEDIGAAFALGWQIARDPAKLIFEDADGNA